MYQQPFRIVVLIVASTFLLTSCAGSATRHEGNSQLQLKDLAAADIGSRLKVTTKWEIVEQVYTTSPKGFVTFKEGVAVFDGYLRDINKNELTLVSSRDLLNRSLTDLTGAEKVRLDKKAITAIERL